MALQERHRPEDFLTESNPGGGTPGGELDAFSTAAFGLLAKGDAVINRALAKGNSETFLAANRQLGGE